MYNTCHVKFEDICNVLWRVTRIWTVFCRPSLPENPPSVSYKEISRACANSEGTDEPIHSQVCTLSVVLLYKWKVFDKRISKLFLLGMHDNSVSMLYKSIGVADRPQWAHNVKMTSYQRRCDVITSHRRWYDVILMLFACWAITARYRFKNASWEMHYSPRNSLKYFEITVPRHISFAELRKNSIEKSHCTNEM